MALSIKNELAERLARELAEQTRTTITQALIKALEEALVRARGRRAAPSILDDLREIGRRCAALPDLDPRPADEILGYNEHGAFR